MRDDERRALEAVSFDWAPTPTRVWKPPEAHVEKLRRLEAAGVDQWNIYLMTDGQEETLATYGEQIIPALAAEAVPPASG